MSSKSDLEAGFLRDSSDSNTSRSHKSDTVSDALFGTTARKIVTAVSAAIFLVLLIVIVAIASRLAADSNTTPAPIVVAASSTGMPAPGSTGSPSGVIQPVQFAGRFMRYPGQPETSAAAMPVNLTIGFIADTYITEDTMLLYRQMRADGAEVIVVSGDLDYIDFADGWDQLITKTLGASFPMLVSAGNHDYAIWPEYQAHLIRRWQAAAVTTCEGVPGVMHTCTWKGVTIVQVAPGVFNESRGLYRNLSGIGDADFVGYIRDAFAKYPSPWRICSWHKNQHLMQTGDKTDETGWGVYNECLRQGAMVMTGHEHSYERSYQMSSFQSQTVKTTANPSKLTLTPTDGIVVVQGLGGRGIRVDKVPQATWWAKKSNADTGATFSANICKYNVNGNAKQAYCYGKDLNRRIIDEYWITLP